MLETDGLFRLAASNFQRAEMHLTDTEVQLRKLRVRLEKCAALARRDTPSDLLREQVEAILDAQPAGTAAASTT
jgi:hypothetical protein